MLLILLIIPSVTTAQNEYKIFIDRINWVSVTDTSAKITISITAKSVGNIECQTIVPGDFKLKSLKNLKKQQVIFYEFLPMYEERTKVSSIGKYKISYLVGKETDSLILSLSERCGGYEYFISKSYNRFIKENKVFTYEQNEENTNKKDEENTNEKSKDKTKSSDKKIITTGLGGILNIGITGDISIAHFNGLKNSNKILMGLNLPLKVKLFKLPKLPIDVYLDCSVGWSWPITNREHEWTDYDSSIYKSISSDSGEVVIYNLDAGLCFVYPNKYISPSVYVKYGMNGCYKNYMTYVYKNDTKMSKVDDWDKSGVIFGFSFYFWEEKKLYLNYEYRNISVNGTYFGSPFNRLEYHKLSIGLIFSSKSIFIN